MLDPWPPAPALFARPTERPGATRSGERRFEAWAFPDCEPLAALWQRAEAAGLCLPCQGFAWARLVAGTILRPRGAQPLFVLVCDAETGAEVMIVPLVVTVQAGCRRLEWLDGGVTDYAAPVLIEPGPLAPADAEAAWAAVLAAVPRCDVIDIPRIPQRIGAVANPLAALQGLRISRFTASGLALCGPAEDFVARVAGRSFKRSLAKSRNRLRPCGPTTLHIASSPAEVDELFAVLCEQRLERFRRLGRFDLLARPEIRAFYAQAAQALLASGAVRLLGLRCAGTWVATSYCLVDARGVHALLLSMAGGPWEFRAPGIVMMAETITWACREGLPYFDLSIGDMSYKARLGGTPQVLFDLVEARSPAGRLLLGIRRLKCGALRTLARVPRAYDALQRLRRALRRRIG